MIIVRIKNSCLLILLFLVIISCKINSDKSKIESVNPKDTVTYDYSGIETISYFEENDSINKRFDEELILTLPVREKDTVLFRKWGVDLYNYPEFEFQKSKVKIYHSNFVKFYKTGNDKFSLHALILKNETNQKDIFTIYSYTDFSIYNRRNPYDTYTLHSFPTISKKSNNEGVFDFSRINKGEFYMDFEIKKDEIHITKITEEISYFTDKAYELDTLIVINKQNKYIDVCRLYNATQKEKNLKK